MRVPNCDLYLEVIKTLEEPINKNFSLHIGLHRSPLEPFSPTAKRAHQNLNAKSEQHCDKLFAMESKGQNKFIL